ncbi:MAG TPA: trehalose-phosphatase [Thermoanaerobaculia bacterium]|nr:trehalose-phosphatase [Thermoanaerobaculia bacterium]
MSRAPSALADWPELARQIGGRRLVVFLDFDGTLSPIVENPEDAAILPASRAAVERLARRVPVVVVSGRGREDVAARVGLPGLVYAGSHGFDIAGPGVRHEVGPELPPLIARATERLEDELAAVPGAQVEPKRYTVAVHYRRVAPGDEAAVEAAVDSVVAAHPELRRAGGKKVWEVRPRLDWDKGKALLYLLDALDLAGPGVLPLYVGDDVTDEDAFRALAERPGGGVGIRVADEPAQTAATWRLDSTGEVPELLERLLSLVP